MRRGRHNLHGGRYNVPGKRCHLRRSRPVPTWSSDYLPGGGAVVLETEAYRHGSEDELVKWVMRLVIASILKVERVTRKVGRLKRKVECLAGKVVWLTRTVACLKHKVVCVKRTVEHVAARSSARYARSVERLTRSSAWHTRPGERLTRSCGVCAAWRGCPRGC